MASRHSRKEAFAKVRSTLPDRPASATPQQVSIIDEANYQDNRGVLQLRGIEAGPGISIIIADADNSRFITRETKLVISAIGGGSGSGVADVAIQIASLVGIIPPGPGVASVIVTPIPLPPGGAIYAVTLNGLDLAPADWTFTGPSTLTVGPLNYFIQNTDELVVFVKS